MGTVSKALNLLGYFSRGEPEIGLSELARRAGLNKATAYRLMTEMQAQGFVEQVGQGRAYRLGPSVLRLASLREAAVPMRDGAQAVLDRLAEDTGETAHLSLLEGPRLATFAYAYAPAHALSIRMDDAEVLPFHATSSGLAVLAFAGPERIEATLAGPLPALTDHTLTDPQAIRARLAVMRGTGLSESVGGFEAEVHSLAVPLFDAAGAVTGALAVATPSQRMSPALHATITAALPPAAREIAALWGGSVPSALEQAWQDAV